MRVTVCAAEFVLMLGIAEEGSTNGTAVEDQMVAQPFSRNRGISGSVGGESRAMDFGL